MKHAFATLLILLGSAASAQDRLTPEEFDSYSRGKTLFYGHSGKAYGAEIYHENRRVTWSFLDGLCKQGEWFASDGLICFVYEDNANPQCWSFERNAAGLAARFEGNSTTTETYEAEAIDAEMICLGPKVGV